MASSDDQLAREFDTHRQRLLAVAYRLTGRPDDAEDAVQDAWLRLARLPGADRDAIDELGAWLTTVVGRICLDRMRSAAVRRESYVGPWLPEPVVTSVSDAPADPLELAVRNDDMRMAAMRVLHQLSPDQRLAFVLHDGFQVPFADIADIAGCTVATARQQASRARKIMADAQTPSRVAIAEQRRVLDAFLEAVASRDIAAVTRILHPQAAVYGDSDGKARTARQPIVGQDKVARFAVGLIEKYGDVLLDVRPVLVNGDLGFVLPAGTAGASPRVNAFAVRDGLVAEIHDIVNPDKLTRVDVG